MNPRNPLNDSDVDGNTMAWMNDRSSESLFEEEKIEERDEDYDS